MNARMTSAFERPFFSAYLPVGAPDVPTSLEAMRACLRAGAAGLEVGIPFSDPAADGPTIEAATAGALRSGTRVDDAFEVARTLRDEFPDAVLVAMTYANIAYHMGWDRFARRAADAGFDGVILPDVPLEESAPIRAALANHGVSWIPLVTPTTPPDRMAQIAGTATGFLYVVASVGTTGQHNPGPLLEATVERARAAAPTVPLVVGFGVSSRPDVERIQSAGAHGAIVGSHLVRLLDQGPARIEAEVRTLTGT